MSAICGIFNFDGKPVDPEALKGMMDTMAYWGPDSSGSWQDGPVGLGHLMLHTTPESMHETLPLKNASGNLVITADARIDNREELFEALGIPHPERTRMPDSAIILKAYEKWGKNCPTHLLGDFAFAIWDERKRRLYCARDHGGYKPFFYHRSSNFFAFGTAIKSLFTLPAVPRRLNETRIADFLVLLPIDGKISFYDDIFRLPPAHAMTVTPDVFEISQYWFLEQVPEIHLRYDQEYVEAFREIFFEAVRCRLRSARPVGILLSGGLDSGSVACVAARQLREKNKRLYAFSSVPLKGFNGPVGPGRIADETPYIEAIRCQEDNIDVTYDSAPGRTPLTALERSYWLFDRPLHAVGNHTWVEALMEAARDRCVGVILSGQVGNGTLSWNGAGYYAKLAREGHWLTLLRELHGCATRKKDLWGILRSQVLKPLIPETIWMAYQRSKIGGEPWLRYSHINPAFAFRMGISERFRALGWDPTFRPLPDIRAQRYGLLTPKRTEVGDIWATLCSGFCMEARDPTADKRVVEFCLGVPANHYIKKGQDRLLVRRAMDGILPTAVQWSTVRGGQGADLFYRLRKSWGEVEMLLDRIQRSSSARQYLDMPRMRRVMGTLRHRTKQESDLIALLTLLRGVALGNFVLWLQEEKW